MKKHIRNARLGLYIFLMLSCFTVNADTSKPTTSEVEYHYPEGEKYHRFLPVPPPQELHYNTRMKASENIDNTPEKETLILMTADTDISGLNGKWTQAFLIIAEAETEAALPKKRDLFKLFDTGTHALDVPAAKVIELQNPRFVFTQPPKDAQTPNTVSFRLVDLTGDGILDVWVECGYAVVVISFQNGAFKEVFSSYWGKMHQPEYVDLNNDSSYEIKIPNTISVNGIPDAACPEWISLYEWNGTAYVLNNERFYAENDAFLIRLLRQYNYQMSQYGRFIRLCETYSFYVGLTHYYRGSEAPARWYLHWLLEHAKNDDYIRAADMLLKHLPPQQK